MIKWSKLPKTDLTIADYTVTPIEDVFIENLDEESECTLGIDACGICGGNGTNDTDCCGDAVPDCSGECGGNDMSCNGNCFDDASNNCETYDNPDACELNDACHWNELYDDDWVEIISLDVLDMYVLEVNVFVHCWAPR